MGLIVAVCLLGVAGGRRAGAFSLGAMAAAEEGQGEEKGHGTVFKWINLALLVGGLGFVLRKPLAQFFLDRSASISKGLEEGRKALEAADAQLQAVEQKLKHFEEEMAAFRAGALKEMGEEHENLRRMAAQEAAKILDSVRVQMDVASKQARLELRLHAASLAVEMAEKMVIQRIDAPAQKRLVSQFLDRLGAKSQSG